MNQIISEMLLILIVYIGVLITLSICGYRIILYKMPKNIGNDQLYIHRISLESGSYYEISSEHRVYKISTKLFDRTDWENRFRVKQLEEKLMRMEAKEMERKILEDNKNVDKVNK